MKANITLSFTSSSINLKRANTRTGGYFVMVGSKLLKEYATYESALKCYRNTEGSCIIPKASAMQFYGELLS